MLLTNIALILGNTKIVFSYFINFSYDWLSYTMIFYLCFRIMKAVIASAVVFAALSQLVSGLAVMSVDLGTEWMKVAIVSVS